MIPVAVLVVAKAPVAGQAKTRLTPPLLPRDGARVAAAALLDTLIAVARCPVERRVVALTGDLSKAECAADLADALQEFDVIDQRGEGFAQRLANAHADCAALTGLPTLQIGMDTPQADSTLLAECAETLLNGEGAVLGFADDGGWWLLGLSDPASAEVLVAVPMSTARTGEETRAAFEHAGVPVTCLPGLRDVDNAADVILVYSHPNCGNHFHDIVADLVPLLTSGRPQ